MPRYKFTKEDCRKGFQKAEESIAKRYPGADAHFLMCALIGSIPQRKLLERMMQDGTLTEGMTDADFIRLFGRE